jgi:hypothetical protein
MKSKEHSSATSAESSYLNFEGFTSMYYTSDRRTAANRENAKKSTGPITLEGKGKSCLNRLSHGFASNTRLIAGEDPEEFYALLNDLIQEHNPATPTQQMLVEDMAHNRWLNLRAFRLQGDILANRTVFIGIPKELALLIRYQTTADRAFHRAYTALLKSQKQTENSDHGFESQKAASASQTTAAAPPADPLPAREMPVQPEPRPEMKPVQPELAREMAADGEKFSSAA